MRRREFSEAVNEWKYLKQRYIQNINSCNVTLPKKHYHCINKL